MNHDHGMKQFTEPIFAELAGHRAELAQHPMLTAARRGELSPALSREFAFQQYADSILWIPMLAQMKSKAVRSARLRRAIADNIAHEAGLDASRESHVTLAVRLLRSLGITDLAAMPTETFERSATLWLSDEFATWSEPAVAGWLLAAETLVPLLFEAVLPTFAGMACDTRYFAEHVAVDGDEHSAWMAEAVLDVIAEYGTDAALQVREGMTDAYLETRSVPDELWSRR